MREVVLDTETTGLDPLAGHRVVEIGCVELRNHLPTGEVFQRYLNPEREMPGAAFDVHGLSDAFLREQRLFGEIADEFLSFIGDDPLIAHNAEFDLGFVNAELRRIDCAPLPSSRAIDTIKLARRKFPGAPASLDALCRRFGVDLSGRQKHGALLDSALLAEVYLELIGGRQPGLVLTASALRPSVAYAPRPARRHAASAAELAAHAAFVATLTEPIWNRTEPGPG
jgi:DNA polymerase-3 subunit epsilon